MNLMIYSLLINPIAFFICNDKLSRSS